MVMMMVVVLMMMVMMVIMVVLMIMTMVMMMRMLLLMKVLKRNKKKNENVLLSFNLSRSLPLPPHASCCPGRRHAHHRHPLARRRRPINKESVQNAERQAMR